MVKKANLQYPPLTGNLQFPPLPVPVLPAVLVQFEENMVSEVWKIYLQEWINGYCFWFGLGSAAWPQCLRWATSYSINPTFQTHDI
jgi:hypothetical protein